jgi:hypothetical protein
MRDKSVRKSVLEELGPEQLRRLAGMLGTSERTTERVVDETVASLSGTLADSAKSPQGADELARAFVTGGFKGGVMVSVLARVSMPVARMVASRTGLPVTQVAKAMKILIPLVMAALSRRAKKRNVRAGELSGMLASEQENARPDEGSRAA